MALVTGMMIRASRENSTHKECAAPKATPAPRTCREPPASGQQEARRLGGRAAGYELYPVIFVDAIVVKAGDPAQGQAQLVVATA